MKIEKKLMIIAGIALTLSLVGFFVGGNPENQGIFTNMFEMFVLTFILFIFISINFFALLFCFKKAKQFFKKT